MRCAVIVAPLLLAGCFPPVELPPPQQPTHELPPVAAALPPAPPGRALVVLDTPGEPARVSVVTGTGTGYDTEGNLVSTTVTKELCTTPCVHDLRPGPHTLLFTSTVDAERSDALDIQLGSEPLVVRHIPEDNSGQWGFAPALALGLAGGACLIPMGGGFTLAGAGDSDHAFEYTGIALLTLGVAAAVTAVVAGYAGRGEHRNSSTTEWTLPATPGGAPAASAEMGDVAARINAPDVFHLPVHSDPPSVPAELRGLRVLLVDRVVGVGSLSALETPALAQAACQQDGAALATELGWVPVLEASQPHELVWRADCNAGVLFTTASNGSLFVLLHPDVHGSRLEAPDGTLVDELPPPPTTELCPVADQAQCTASFSGYVHAHVIGAIAGSAKLRAFASANRQAHPRL